MLDLKHVLILFITISAVITIHARERGARNRLFVFKPLTMVLIVLFAFLKAAPRMDGYFYFIFLGLLMGLAGDIFLMMPSDRFIAGLITFLIGHSCYISAFTTASGFRCTWWLLFPFLIFGVVTFMILLPSLRKLRIPVALYSAIMVLMAWQAWERWHRMEANNTLWAAIGSIFFLISDSALALNRFRRSLSNAQKIILGSYYTAQLMIASSVGI